MNTTAITGMSANAASTMKTASSTGEGSSEKDMFMTLLVAQLKNQDPLQPQDGAAFVAQLSQFNSLDQLIGIRESMDKLVTSMQTK